MVNVKTEKKDQLMEKAKNLNKYELQLIGSMKIREIPSTL